MKQNDYIVIQSFMVTNLGLSGNRLIIYALIHGFCKDGEHEFTGSIKYICDWTNLTKNTVISTIKTLVDDGLIIKREYIANNVRFCAYSIGGGAKIAPLVQMTNKSGAKNALGGGAKIAPNNIINNTVREKNKEKEIEESISTKKEKDELFEKCWIAYNRKGSKKQAKMQWDKLDDDERTSILPHIKAYVSSRELNYQKDFERYIRDKTFLSIVLKGNQVIYDPIKKDTNDYMPQTSPLLAWNDYYNCYFYLGFWDGHIADGYSDDERPNGASVTLNNGRGTVIWDKVTKMWKKK